MSSQYYVYYGRFHKWGVAHEMGEEIIAQTEKEAERILRKHNGNIQAVYIALLGFARPGTNGDFWVMGEVITRVHLTQQAIENMCRQLQDAPF